MGLLRFLGVFGFGVKVTLAYCSFPQPRPRSHAPSTDETNVLLFTKLNDQIGAFVPHEGGVHSPYSSSGGGFCI